VAAVLVCLAYFIFLYNFVNIQVAVRVPFAPDENAALATSKFLLNGGSVFWTSVLNQRYGVSFFRPRSFAEVGPNTYVAVTSVGFALLLALATRFGVLPFIVSITAAGGILAAYGLLAEIYDKKAGLFLEMTIGLIPTVVYFANSYFDIVPSVSFYVVSLLAFIKFLKTNNTYLLVSCALSLAISILLRPYSALFAIGYLVTIIAIRKKVRLRPLAIGVLCFLIFLAPLFIINNYAYGSPFRFGVASAVGPSNFLEFLEIQQFGSSAYLTTLAIHFVELTPVLFVIGLLGGIFAVIRKRNHLESALLINLSAVSIIALFAFGSLSHTSGFYEVAPDASVSRYLMPIYILLSCSAYIFVKRLLDMRMRRLSLLVASMLMLTLLAGSFAHSALPSLVTYEHKYAAIENAIQSLPAPSVLFTRTFDKLAFPTQNVALVYTVYDLAQDPDLRYLFPIVNIDTDVAPVISKLLANGFHVFLASDVDDLAAQLLRSGFVLEPWFYGLREVLFRQETANRLPTLVLYQSSCQSQRLSSLYAGPRATTRALTTARRFDLPPRPKNSCPPFLFLESPYVL